MSSLLCRRQLAKIFLATSTACLLIPFGSALPGCQSLTSQPGLQQPCARPAALQLRGGGGLRLPAFGAREGKKQVVQMEQKSEKINYAKSGGLLCSAVFSTIALEMISDWMYVEVVFGIQAYQLLISFGYVKASPQSLTDEPGVARAKTT